MNWTLGSKCAPIRAPRMKTSWSHEHLFCLIMTSYLSKQWFWVGITSLWVISSYQQETTTLTENTQENNTTQTVKVTGVKESLSSMQHVWLMKQRCSDMLLGLTSLPHQSGEMGKGIKLSYTTCNDRKNIPHKWHIFFNDDILVAAGVTTIKQHWNAVSPSGFTWGASFSYCLR